MLLASQHEYHSHTLLLVTWRAHLNRRGPKEAAAFPSIGIGWGYVPGTERSLGRSQIHVNARGSKMNVAAVRPHRQADHPGQSKRSLSQSASFRDWAQTDAASHAATGVQPHRP